MLNQRSIWHPFDYYLTLRNRIWCRQRRKNQIFWQFATLIDVEHLIIPKYCCGSWFSSFIRFVLFLNSFPKNNNVSVLPGFYTSPNLLELIPSEKEVSRIIK